MTPMQSNVMQTFSCKLQSDVEMSRIDQLGLQFLK